MKKLMMAAIAACAAMARAATTGDYVQDGLVACWDGWENDGAGGHATTLTEWKDTGGAHPFVFNASAAIEVRPLGLYFPGANADYATLSKDNTPNTFDLCTNGVLEVCIIAEKDATSFLLQSTPTAGIAFGATSISSGNRQLLAGTKATRKYNYDWTAGFGTFSLTYQFGLNTSLHHNGAAVDSSAVGAIGSSTTTAFLGINSNKSPGWAFKGMVYAIRLYETPLTDEQRALNGVMDEMRFKKGDVYPLTGVYVRGEPQNYGDPAKLGYGFVEKSVGDSIELTAPEFVEISQTERAYCTGWKLYDRATGDLISESTAETQHSFTQTYKRPVRLDWQWDVRHPITVSAAEGLTVTPETAWGSAAFPAEFAVEGADFPLWSGASMVGGDVHAKTVSFAPTAATEVSVTAAVVRKPTTVDGIIAAIASSEDGDVVVVPDGIPFAEVTADDMANGLALTKDVLVTSGSGDPKDVTVDLGGTGYGFTLNAAGARLKGITFTSSAAMTDSADLTLPRFVNIIAGTLDGCVFTNIAIGGTSAKGSHPVSLSPDGVIENCRFEDLSCTAQSLTRGAVYAQGGLIRKTVFRSCNTCPAPVVVAGEPSTTVAEDCSFTDINSTDAKLGANAASFYSSNSGATGLRLTAKRILVANNTITEAAVYCGTGGASGGSFALEDCVLTNNVSSSTAGVLGCKNRPSYTLNRCVIANNVGSTFGVTGGGSYCTQTFRNCFILGNTGKKTAGVVYATGSAPRFVFENCTVTGNKTLEGTYPGIAIAGCGTAANTWVKSCIVYGNGESEDDPQLVVDEDRVFSSCFPEAKKLADPADNIFADPQLNADGTLKYTSPCLDAGLNLTPSVGAFDVVGTVRPQNGKGGLAALWDMGCFEMPPNSATLQVSIVLDRTVGTTNVTATAQTSGTDLTGLVYDWTVTRTTPTGSTVTEYKGLTEADLVLEDLEPGTYSFSVVVTNGSGDSEPATCDDTFAAKPAVCHVSKTGSATWPYDTPAKATPSFGEAIGNAAARVEIAAGEYDVAETGTMADPASGDEFMLVVDSPVEVAGAGPAQTKFVLDGVHAAICIANAGATVSGLEVCGAGRTDASFSGSSVRVNSGIASNIVVNGGAAWGSAVFVGPNALFTCGVITNLTRYSNKPCNPVTLSCGTLSDTVIAGCTYATGISVAEPPISTHSAICRVTVANNMSLAGTSGLVANYLVDVSDTDFVGNDSTAGGAVVSASGGAPYSPNLTMTNCRIVGNRIYNCSGAVTLGNYAHAAFTNVLIADNEGVAGSQTAACRGLSVAGSSTSTYRNCTVAGNRTAHAVNAGVSVDTDSAAKTFSNCIFWGNCGTEGEGSSNFEVTGTGTAPSIKNCCWPEATEDGGCTSGDPKLRTVRRFRCYPSPSGSCYETGDATGWTEDDVDLAGKPRLRDGKVDIGCFQAVPLPGFMLMLK